MKSIQLLNEKNHFLEKFYTLNENQLVELLEGKFHNIEIFYNQREDILKIIKYIDSQIQRYQQDEVDMKAPISEEDKQVVKRTLKVKDLFVTQIIEQDIQIISIIDRLKSDVIRELKSVRETKRAISGYKSSLAS
jgi:hypothetical protein